MRPESADQLVFRDPDAVEHTLAQPNPLALALALLAAVLFGDVLTGTLARTARNGLLGD